MLCKTRPGARPGWVGAAARLTIATAVAITTLAAAASSASADTFYVAKGGGGTSCTEAAPCSTITTAVNASRDTAGQDRIVVGPGVFVEAVVLTFQDNSLEIVGAGSSSDPGQATIIQPPNAVQAPIVVGDFLLAPNDVSIRSLRIHLPADVVGPLEALVSYSQRLSVADVAVVFERSVPVDRIVAVYGPDSSFDRVRVESAGQGRAIAVFGQNFRLRDSVVTSAAVALQPESSGTRVERSTLTTTGNTAAVFVLSDGASLDSTVIRGGDPTIELYGGLGEATLRLDNVTVDAGDPGADATKFALQARADGAGKAHIVVRNSIVLERSNGDDDNETSITCAFTAAPGQVAPGPNGKIDCGPGTNGNIDTTPAALFGGALAALVPPFGSPAIDGGDPAPLPAGASTTDRAGKPRVTDGDGDGTAVIDRGAYELPAPPPPPSPPTTPLVLSGLKVAPKRFRVARRATPRVAASAKAKRKRRAKAGATISYRVNKAARVVLTIERRAAGRRGKGGRCVAPKRAKRGARRCVRWVVAGKLTRRVGAGKQRTPFSGRIGRKALRRGAHRVRAVATDADGNRSRAIKPKPFKIVR